MTITPATATVAQQVTKLYDLIAGYHATHLIEIARELGVWEAVTARPGMIATKSKPETPSATLSTNVCAPRARWITQPRSTRTPRCA
ncbi:MAG: hypothetical protein AAB295_12480, partial [Chloroflexota bacterium]